MDLKALAPAAIAFVVLAITISIGVEVVTDVGASCTNLTATAGQDFYCGADVYANGNLGLAEISSWLPTLGLVLAAAVVIGTVVAYFSFRK